ncbi:hypothetical protein ARZXY2_2233 [Arthrobacter sp. ZXY-2]|nr:hypothetical protein ARZXY2_2233 [Arthrobacter sp. ZXY-2]
MFLSLWQSFTGPAVRGDPKAAEDHSPWSVFIQRRTSGWHSCLPVCRSSHLIAVRSPQETTIETGRHPFR